MRVAQTLLPNHHWLFHTVKRGAVMLLVACFCLMPTSVSSQPTAPIVPPQINCISPPATSLVAPSHATIVPCLGGASNHYEGGWQLVGGYAGVDVFYADGPLYTLTLGAASYQIVSSETAAGVTWTPLQPGIGYWVYFNEPTDVYFPPPPPSPQTVSIPTMPGTWALVGDPYETAALVTGADALYTYDSASGYREATSVRAGQGAFAHSDSGGTVTLEPDPGG